jgi:hypothetical protein
MAGRRPGGTLPSPLQPQVRLPAPAVRPCQYPRSHPSLASSSRSRFSCSAGRETVGTPGSHPPSSSLAHRQANAQDPLRSASSTGSPMVTSARATHFTPTHPLGRGTPVSDPNRHACPVGRQSLLGLLERLPGELGPSAGRTRPPRWSAGTGDGEDARLRISARCGRSSFCFAVYRPIDGSATSASAVMPAAPRPAFSGELLSGNLRPVRPV